MPTYMVERYTTMIRKRGSIMFEGIEAKTPWDAVKVVAQRWGDVNRITKVKRSRPPTFKSHMGLMWIRYEVTEVKV